MKPELIELDGAFILTYQDGVYTRETVFLDWYSAQANLERRTQESAQESAQGASDEK